jgi:N-glycosylase/DNA lyase
MQQSESHLFLPVKNYALEATLTSGQAFRWWRGVAGWEGVIGPRWVQLEQKPGGILATVAEPVAEWGWLENYLQTRVDFEAIIKSFPSDEPIRLAVSACRGLRLLQQDPWECLASFICSSTKQIVQIQQIIALLCERFGDPVAAPPGYAPVFAFPSAGRIASLTESELRSCKMGFRAPNLLRTAQAIAGSASLGAKVDLDALRSMPLDRARKELVKLSGVGPKIADCVLLFAFGFQQAFPVDVWIAKALHQLYFPKRRPTPARLIKFSQTYFAPNAGYAQQYLFHYMRTVHPRTKPAPRR